MFMGLKSCVKTRGAAWRVSFRCCLTIKIVLRRERIPELCRKLGESGAAFVSQRFDRKALAWEHLSILKRVATTS